MKNSWWWRLPVTRRRWLIIYMQSITRVVLVLVCVGLSGCAAIRYSGNSDPYRIEKFEARLDEIGLRLADIERALNAPMWNLANIEEGLAGTRQQLAQSGMALATMVH